MPAEKTTAIVLKVVDFSETSCVVTLLTREFGKISALAKGARRKKSPFEGALDLLAICRIVFLRKSVDSLDLLTEAKLLRRFRSASRDLHRLYASMYVIELVKLLTDEGDPQTELFDLVCDTIVAIDDKVDKDSNHLPWLVVQFELRMLQMIGHGPALEQCVGCGRAMPQGEQAYFGLLAGGVFCKNCRSGHRGIVVICADTLTVLQRLLQSSASVEANRLGKRNLGEVRGLLDQVIANLLGFRPKMYPYLRPLFK